jgi:hypothetical protein
MLLQSFIDALLCFGPLFVIVIAVFWLFNRLDTRWKAEALKTKGLRTSIRQEVNTLCWQLLDCPPEQREYCPAYQNQDVPCWEHFRSADDLLDEKCIDCQVFIGLPA